MARQITGLTPTTELEALNEMLAGIGEAPVLQAELESPTQADVTMAVNFLTESTRQVLTMGWRFNTEYGFQIQSADTYAWTGSDSATATLLIFERPSDLLDWVLTSTAKQANLNVVLRPPRDYSAAEGVLVFYDAEENRDGFESADLDGDSLYIEGVFAIDFEDCPETLRFYITKLAAMRLQSRLMGARSLDMDSEQELQAAWRNVIRSQGRAERHNIFNNHDMLSKLGLNRNIQRGYRLDTRNSPRP